MTALSARRSAGDEEEQVEAVVAEEGVEMAPERMAAAGKAVPVEFAEIEVADLGSGVDNQ